MRLAFIALVMLAVPLSASAQVKNPTRCIFNPGFDVVAATGYEIDIVAAGGAVAQTLTFPVQTPDAAGDVTLTINVQPVAFGDYTVVVRTVYGTFKSIDSAPSDVWQRVPGQPSKPRVVFHLEPPAVKAYGARV